MSELSRATDGAVSQAHLSRLESGQRQASPKMIRILARTLGVPMTAILRDPESTDAGQAVPS